MEILLPIALIIILLVFFYPKDKKDTFSPITITLVVWLIVLTLLFFYQDKLIPVKENFIISITFWILMLSITSNIFKKIISANNKIPLEANHLIINVYYITIILFTPLYLYITYQTVQELGGSENLLFDLRNLDTENKKKMGILIYLKTLVKAVYLYELFRLYKPKINIRLYFIIIVNILFALSNMEKGYLLFLIITSIYYFYSLGKISRKTIFISFSSVIFLSYLFNTLRLHQNSKGYDFMYFLASYLVGPSLAFGTLKVGEGFQEFGANTFAFFYSLSNSLFGTDFVIEAKLKDPVFIPIPTNVFTIMQPFYEDFGYLGVMIFSVLTSFIVTYYYKKSLSGHPLFKAFYANIISLLLFQFFQEEIFVSLSVFIQFIILLYLPFYINNVKWK